MNCAGAFLELVIALHWFGPNNGDVTSLIIYDETMVKRFVTIARTEEDKFIGSVLECAVKFTIILEK